MTSQNPIVAATTKMCIEFQVASASGYRDAREVRDGYEPRVTRFQQIAADLAAEARIRLDRLNGHA